MGKAPKGQEAAAAGDLPQRGGGDASCRDVTAAAPIGRAGGLPAADWLPGGAAGSAPRPLRARRRPLWRRPGRGSAAAPRCAGRAGRGAPLWPRRWATASRLTSAPRGRRRAAARRRRTRSGTATTSRRTSWRRSRRSPRRRCRRTRGAAGAAGPGRGAGPRGRSPQVGVRGAGGAGASRAEPRLTARRALSSAGGGADTGLPRDAFRYEVLQTQHEEIRHKVGGGGHGGGCGTSRGCRVGTGKRCRECRDAPRPAAQTSDLSRVMQMFYHFLLVSGKTSHRNCYQR